MRECFVVGENLTEAYHKALIALRELGEKAPCDDWDTTQLELSLTMVVKNPLQEPMISKLFIGGPRELEQYRQEMLNGIMDFEVSRGNWAYTYHHRMVHYPIGNGGDMDQIHYVVRTLQKNPSSRRAVILIRENTVDAYGSDPACMQHLQYFIRDGKLYCKALFRSNDACKASFMNCFALIMLQKRIANEIGVEVGEFTLRANSYHCYEKDFDMLDGYEQRILSAQLATEQGEDGTYEVASDYVGDWEEMMEEYKPLIKDMVQELRDREVKTCPQ